MAQINRDQLLERARREVPEVTAHEVKTQIDQRADVTIIDIREREEFVQGHVPGALFIPRGYLELQIEQYA
ncbi:MAG: rhodanese-like domain-containing protein, partial [Caldilinea sp.]